MKCNECNNANICLDHIEFPSLNGCTSGTPDRKVITNADSIRNMSDEELGLFFAILDLSLEDNDLPAPNDWLVWLQLEAE